MSIATEIVYDILDNENFELWHTGSSECKLPSSLERSAES